MSRFGVRCRFELSGIEALYSRVIQKFSADNAAAALLRVQNENRILTNPATSASFVRRFKFREKLLVCLLANCWSLHKAFTGVLGLPRSAPASGLSVCSAGASRSRESPCISPIPKSANAPVQAWSRDWNRFFRKRPVCFAAVADGTRCAISKSNSECWHEFAHRRACAVNSQRRN